MRFPLLRFTLAALLPCLPSTAFFAQEKTTPAPAKPAYPVVVKTVSVDPFAGESFVIDNALTVYAMKADGTGYRERTVAAKIQSEASLKVLSVVDVPFASASEHVEFHYARARHADGSVTESPVSGALEQADPVTREAPFYSDLKHMQLPIKNLKVGDSLEWEARIVRTRAEAPGHFWGEEAFIDDGTVVKKQVIELRVPAGKFVTVWTNPKSGVKPVESAAGEEKVYRWEFSALKPNTGAAAEAEKKAKKTRLHTEDEEDEDENGKLPSLAWTTFKSWAEVGAWYRGLEGDRAVPDDEIKAKVAELTAGKKTEEEKVRAVYAYVSTQIRYIGVAFGIGRYQPHEAVDVLHNQYGDCKDKEMLLASMLSVLKVPTDAALIGAQVRFNPDVPSPGAFNHLITHTHVDGKVVWLDATEEVAPYGMMYAVLRDKKALVVPETGEAKIETTVATIPFDAYMHWSSKGSLDKDGNSDSHIEMTFRGDDELTLRATLRQVAAAQYPEFAQAMIKGIGYGGTTSHPDFSRPEDTDEPLHMNLDYHREKGGNWESLQMAPQLPPLPFPRVNEKEPPVAAINLGELHTEISTAEMKLPEGWSVELPEAVHQKQSYATYDVTYKFDHGTVEVERRVTILQKKVPAKDWKAYKKFLDAVYDGEPYIQMKRAGVTQALGAAEGHKTNAEATSLINQAYDSENLHRDTKTAEALLKRAKDLDAQAEGLWAALGYIARRKGKPSEAIEDYRKELALYPRNVRVYDYLNSAYLQNHDRAGAERALAEWIAADPNDPHPEGYLAYDLNEDKKPADAVPHAARALTLAPEDDVEDRERRTVLLGRLQLKAGMTKDGEATLVGVLKSTTKAGTMNDAGYELANVNLDMPLAESKVHEALGLLEAETENWTMDEEADTLLKKTHLLVATWDSWGWVLFREGKTNEAQTWLEAAWTNNQSSEEREHVDAEREALHLSPMETGRKSEQALRTISLGSYNGPKSSGEYRLLMQHGKVLRAVATGKEVPGAEEMLKQASFASRFPVGSNAKLVRLGVVNCVSGHCEVVME